MKLRINGGRLKRQAASYFMGYTNYILSNNFPELPVVVENLGLGKYFAGYFVSSAAGYEKPRAELFRRALQAAGNPEIRYMIGDNSIADIRGGHDVGMRTVLLHMPASSACIGAGGGDETQKSIGRNKDSDIYKWEICNSVFLNKKCYRKRHKWSNAPLCLLITDKNDRELCRKEMLRMTMNKGL